MGKSIYTGSRNSIWNQLKIRAALVLLLVGGTPGVALGQYCTITEQGISEVKAELLSVPAEVEADYKSLKEALDSLERDIKTAETSLKANFATSTFNALESRLKKLSLDIGGVIEQVPASKRGISKGLVASYFYLAHRLLQIEVFGQPKSTDLKRLRDKYSLQLSLDAFSRVYPAGLDLMAGLNVEASKGAKQQLTKTLKLSGETLVNILVRSSALSPAQLQGSPETSYVDTVRCGGARVITGKIKLNQALLNRDNDPILVKTNEGQFAEYKDQIVCSQTKAEEFVRISQTEVNNRKESIFRSLIAKSLPNFEAYFDKNTEALLEKYQAGSFAMLIASNPNFLYELNEALSQNDLPQMSRQDYDTLAAGITNAFNNALEQIPAFKSLAGLWSTKAFSDILELSIKDCQFDFGDTTVEEVRRRLALMENFNFIYDLIHNLGTLPLVLVETPTEDLHALMKDYIYDVKLASLNQAYDVILSSFARGDTTAEVGKILAAAQQDIRTALEPIFNESWKSAGFDQVVDGLLKNALAEQENVLSLNIKLKEYTISMVHAAHMVAKNSKKNKSIDELPLNDDALRLALADYSHGLTKPVYDRIGVMFRNQDFKGRQTQFKVAQDLARTNLKRAGVSCEEPGIVSGLWHTARGFFVGDKQNNQLLATKYDCFNLKVLEHAFGFNQTEGHRRFSEVYESLDEVLDGDQMDLFEREYRAYLSTAIFTEYSALDLELKEIFQFDRQVAAKYDKNFFERFVPFVSFADRNWFEKRKLHELLASIPKEEADQHIDLIRATIEFSLDKLKTHLGHVAYAQKPTDFNELITRTPVIEYILGAHSLDSLADVINGGLGLAQDDDGFYASQDMSRQIEGMGYIFPGLVRFHEELKTGLLRKDGISAEIDEDFLTTNIMVGFAVIGGWALKSTLNFLPRFTGGPLAAAAIHRTWLATSNFFEGHSWFVMGLFAGHIGLLEGRKRAFRSELESLNELLAAETLKPEGTENPLPLLSWRDFKAQETYYRKAIADATSAQMLDAVWLALPIAQVAGRARIAKVTGAVVKRFDNFVSTSNPVVNSVYQAKVSMKIRHQVSLLRSSFKVLGINPNKFESLDVGRLRSHVQLAKGKIGNNPQLAQKMDEAYEQIIYSFGTLLNKYIGRPAGEYAFTKAAFGTTGSKRQMYALNAEFDRILRSMSTPLIRRNLRGGF